MGTVNYGLKTQEGTFKPCIFITVDGIEKLIEFECNIVFNNFEDARGFIMRILGVLSGPKENYKYDRNGDANPDIN